MIDDKNAAELSGASGGSLAWIPVTERLPEEGKLVLVWPARIPLAVFRGFGWADALYGWSLTTKPTHWQPLPAPPTDAK